MSRRRGPLQHLASVPSVGLQELQSHLLAWNLDVGVESGSGARFPSLSRPPRPQVHCPYGEDGSSVIQEQAGLALLSEIQNVDASIRRARDRLPQTAALVSGLPPAHSLPVRSADDRNMNLRHQRQSPENAILQELNALMQMDLNLVSQISRSQGPHVDASMLVQRQRSVPAVDTSRFKTVVFGDPTAASSSRSQSAMSRIGRSVTPTGNARRDSSTSTGIASIQDECSICLTSFAPGQQLKQIPCAGQHVFHKRCAARWFKDHGTCPLCRTDLTYLKGTPMRTVSDTGT